MFKKQHYNKIGALLGRRLAYEYSEGTAITVNSTMALIAQFVIMFQGDNEEFNSDEWLSFLTKKANDELAIMEAKKDGT